MNRRFPFWIALLVAVLAGAALLAACGDEDDGGSVPPSILITVQPQPEATVLPGCRAHDLESWYEVAGTLVFTFTQESMQALGHTPEQVLPLVNRLTMLRDAIMLQPVPECALPVYTEIGIRVRGMLAAFQRYGNGDISSEELRVQIEQLNGEIETSVAQMLADTQASLEEQLSLERATATPAPGP